jgi:hypothetical protein
MYAIIHARQVYTIWVCSYCQNMCHASMLKQYALNLDRKRSVYVLLKKGKILMSILFLYVFYINTFETSKALNIQ